MCRFGYVHRERVTNNFLDCRRREVFVQSLSASSERRTEAAQHHVGVGVGRLITAGVVARRTGSRASGLWSVAKRPRNIDVGQRTAARSDCQHVNAGEDDRVTVLDLPFLRNAKFTAGDQRNVRRGSTHIKPYGIFVPALLSDVLGRDRSGSDARRGQAHRIALHHARCH